MTSSRLVFLLLSLVVLVHLPPFAQSFLLRGRGDDEQDRTFFQEGDEPIIGGTAARNGEFPFYVKFEGSLLCGGSLINNDTVLTAAHCVDDGALERVRIGGTSSSGGYVSTVKCGIRHPDFIETRSTLQNDVAIVKLAEPVDAPGMVETIRFNKDQTYPSNEGTDLTVIGFGLTSKGGVSTQLLKLQTNLVSMDECMDSYPKDVLTKEAHICADVQKAGDCNGDSGGPVFDGDRLQVGIVSFGYGGCASDKFQDVYVNVASYAKWIQSYADGDDCKPAIYGDGKQPPEDEVEVEDPKPAVGVNEAFTACLTFMTQALTDLTEKRSAFLNDFLKRINPWRR